MYVSGTDIKFPHPWEQSNKALIPLANSDMTAQDCISYIATRTKLPIFHSNVKSVLLYGSETRKEMKTTPSKLQTFVNRCLQRILNIHWPEVISHELWRRTQETEMSTQTKRWKWNWIGHTKRKRNEAIDREALDWNPQGNRRRGRPRYMW
jgi:hypothetical protein